MDFDEINGYFFRLGPSVLHDNDVFMLQSYKYPKQWPDFGSKVHLDLKGDGDFYFYGINLVLI